jgi:hypothetical protein
MATRMQQRRGTAAQWTSADPILAAGEIGFESDTGFFKMGDGTNHWSDLSYFKDLGDLAGSFDDYVPLTQKGAANGVATLDGQSQIPIAQLSNIIMAAPEALDTLNEIANEIDGVNGIVQTKIDAAVNTVNSTIDSSIVEGVDDALGNLIAAGTGLTKSFDAQTRILTISADSTLATDTELSTAISDHNSDSTNVHGIADTSVLVVQSTIDALTTDDIAEGTNEYYTDAKAIAANASAIATAKSEAIADATSQVSAVIDSAPSALNTLNELAAALGDDANFASTVTTALDGKVASFTSINQKTSAYTTVLTDRDKLVEVNSSSGVTVTIPTDASVAYPVGTSIDILQTGSGQVTIAGSGGVTVNATPGLKLRTQWSSATLFKRATNTWVVFGDLSA